MSVPNDPLLGQLIGGRYRVERQIGQGGAGAVYAARQIGLDREVAIKILRPELAADATLLERFRREARAAASLDSPHIVQVLDWADPNGAEPAFIALELVRGVSLLELIRREGRLAWPRAIAIVTQILSALATAHRAGIVHRDLKPGNVMVAAVPGLGESVKLLDFGIAQIKEGDAYRRLTQTGVILGTPRYMSPEQLRGAPLDARTDLWAAGVVLYRALTGAFPFDGPPDRVVLAVLGEPPPEIPGSLELPPALSAITLRALAKSPDDRWPSASAMLEALLAVQAPPAVGYAPPETAHAAPVPRAPMPTQAEAHTRIGPPQTLVSVPPEPVASAPPPAQPSSPPSPTRSRSLGTLLLVGGALAALGTITLVLGLVALFVNVERALLEAAPPGPPIPPPGGAGILLPGPPISTAPTPSEAPAEGDLLTYLPLAEAAVHATDPRATLEAAYARGIDETGRVRLESGSAAFTFRLSNGGCTNVVFPTPPEPPPPAICLGTQVLVIPEIAPLVADARAACAPLVAASEPLLLSIVPLTGGFSFSIMTTHGRPSYSGVLTPDGRVQPFYPTIPLCTP